MKYLFCLLLALPLAGCAVNQDAQKELRLITKIAANHVEFEYQEALADCSDPNDCPDAERYKTWLETANRFIGYLDNPVPARDYDRVMLGIAIVKNELELAGETELLLYIGDIEILANELFQGKE